MWSRATWQVPTLAEFWVESGCSFPFSTPKLDTPPVGLPLNESTSEAAKRYLWPGEKVIQATLASWAATQAAVSSPLAGS